MSEECDYCDLEEMFAVIKMLTEISRFSLMCVSRRVVVARRPITTHVAHTPNTRARSRTRAAARHWSSSVVKFRCRLCSLEVEIIIIRVERAVVHGSGGGVQISRR